MVSIEARRSSIIREMFLETADMNYVGARAAFFERRNYDFWWLTLHAVEKYLKATLLMNGATAKNASHNLEALLDRLKKIDSRLVPPPFVRPVLAGPERWFDFHNADFVKWLNIFGSADNRYATYSYVISDIDIFRADHLIYWARRHARPIRQTFLDGEVVDWVSELEKSPSVWRHHNATRLETLADLPEDDEARRSFSRSNVFFFPNANHSPSITNHGLAHNGVIFHCIRALENSVPASVQRIEAREILVWLLGHVHLSRGDVAIISGLLAQYP